MYRYLVATAICMQEFFRAKVFTEREEVSAVQSWDPEAMARAASHTAYIETLIGDTEPALAAMDRFLALDTPHRPALAHQRAALLFNRGTVYIQRRQFAEAVPQFAEARAAYERLREPLQVISCELEAGWAYLRAGDPASAVPFLNGAEAMLREYPNEGLLNTALNHRACWHLRGGDYVTAISLAQEIIALADGGSLTTMCQRRVGSPVSAAWPTVGCTRRSNWQPWRSTGQ